MTPVIDCYWVGAVPHGTLKSAKHGVPKLCKDYVHWAVSMPRKGFPVLSLPGTKGVSGSSGFLGLDC